MDTRLLRTLSLALLLALLVPVHSWAAVAVDSRGQCTAAGTSPSTKSFTVNNTSPLIVAVSWSGTPTVTSVTWNTTETLTELGTKASSASPAEHVSLFLLTAPTTGTHNIVVTWSANPSVGTCFIISTSGGDTVTAVRTVYSRSNSDGTGPGTTVVDSVNGDIVFHAATVSGSTITFDGSEDTTSTEDDAIAGGARSGGLSTLAATGGSTTVGCTDTTTYAELGVSVFATGSAGSTQPASGFLGSIIR